MTQRSASTCPETCMMAVDSEQVEQHSDQFDFTYGLGVTPDPKPTLREQAGGSQSVREYAARRRIRRGRPRASMYPVTWEHEPTPVRHVFHESCAVGATNDPLEPLSYLTGVLALLGSEMNLMEIFVPGGPGLSVPNRVFIIPVPAPGLVPAELHSHLPEDLDPFDLWLLSRHRSHGFAAHTVLEGVLLRHQAALATFVSKSPDQT